MRHFAYCETVIINSTGGGKLKVDVPDMYIYPDLAFKVRRIGHLWKSGTVDSTEIIEPVIEPTARNLVNCIILYPNPNDGEVYHTCNCNRMKKD